MWSKWKAIWGLLGRQRRRFGLAVAALVVATGFMYLPPVVRMWAVDHVIAGKPAASQGLLGRLAELLGGRPSVARDLLIAGLAMVAATALSGLFTYLRGRWSAVASETIARSLRERLYDHLQHLPASYHDNADAGDLVQRCGSDVETVRMFLAGGLTEVGRALILMLVGVPVMVWVSPSMTAATMVLMPLIVVFSVVFFTKVRQTFRRSDEAEGRMTAVLEENLTGIRVVRAFARSEHECGKFAACNADYRNRWCALIRLFAIFWSLSDFLCSLQVAVVLIYGTWLAMTGDLTAGGLFAFLSFVHMFMWPIRAMGRVLADFSKATVSLDRIHEVLSEPREDRCEGAPAEAFCSAGEIVVEHLSFAHDPTPVLRDISFRVEPGQTLAILGPSGSGKSTLVSLLLRLYDYRDGSIRLDGRELRDTDRKHVRRQFGTVLQEPFLYSKTVRDNIRLGGSAAKDDAVVQAAATACIHDTIVKFEKGYETLVGERGVTLSGGQRQRVALARAILDDPPVLILDDALSAVDTQTEQMILGALRQRRGRRTTLLIAHRLSTLRQADRILVLDGGRIVQAGTHEELLGADGLYRRLWDIQYALEDDLQADVREARP